jgi:hypothetical protein
VCTPARRSLSVVCGVVAAFVGGGDTAVYPRERVIEDGCAGGAWLPCDAVETPLGILLREPARDALAAIGKDVDGECGRVANGVVGVGRAIDADDRERRPQRKRGHGIDGQADGSRRACTGRHDGHAGGPVAEDPPVFRGIDTHRRVDSPRGSVASHRPRAYLGCILSGSTPTTNDIC